MAIVSLFLPFQTGAAIGNQTYLQQAQSRSDHFSSYTPSVQKAVVLLEQMPEVRALIAQVQREGPIRIEMWSMENLSFEALWNSEERKIIVNSKGGKSLGKVICSILFELHNATTDRTLSAIFKQAMQGKIDKDSYVAKIEKMEHENAVKTCQLIEKGIQRGLFPQDTRWNIYEDFESHYMIQQLYGHSQWLADNFDLLSPNTLREPYHGTIEGLSTMSQADKKELTRYVTIKNGLKSTSAIVRAQAQNQLDEEIQSLKKYENDYLSQSSKRYLEKKKLFNLIFDDFSL